MAKRAFVSWFFVLALLLVPYVFACDHGFSGVIAKSTTLCTSSYNVEKTIVVKNSLDNNITIDCNGSTITAENSNVVLFYIDHGKNIVIKNCIFRGFNKAIFLNHSKAVFILSNKFTTTKVSSIFLNATSDSEIRNNSFGNEKGLSIFLYNSENNKLIGNNFEKNLDFTTAYDLYLNNSVNNKIWKNRFNRYVFDTNEKLNDYCSFKNIYPSSVMDMCLGNVQTSGANTSTLNESNKTAAAETKQNDSTLGNSTLKTIKLKPDIRRINKTITKIADAELLTAGQRKKRINELMDNYHGTTRFVAIGKSLTTGKGKTTIKLRIKIKNSLKDLYIYEDIPKCIINSTKDIVFLGKKPDRILIDDPLIMWHFADVKEGQVIDLSYKINHETKIMPKTYATTKGVKIERTKEGICSEDDLPLTIATCKRKSSGYKIYLALLVVPVIIFGYLYFSRFSSKEQGL